MCMKTTIGNNQRCGTYSLLICCVTSAEWLQLVIKWVWWNRWRLQPWRRPVIRGLVHSPGSSLHSTLGPLSLVSCWVVDWHVLWGLCVQESGYMCTYCSVLVLCTEVMLWWLVLIPPSHLNVLLWPGLQTEMSCCIFKVKVHVLPVLFCVCTCRSISARSVGIEMTMQ